MLVMGILNATPDSFADGGEHFTYPDAVDHGLKLIAEGADIIDVGGESTRPGAERVSAAEEERRVINVISKLVDAGKPISIDTMRASTARARARDWIPDRRAAPRCRSATRLSTPCRRGAKKRSRAPRPCRGLWIGDPSRALARGRRRVPPRDL